MRETPLGLREDVLSSYDTEHELQRELRDDADFTETLLAYERIERPVPRVVRELHRFVRTCNDVANDPAADEEEWKRRLQQRLAAEDVLDSCYAKLLPSEKPELFRSFSDSDLDLLLEQTNFVELTEGCSIGCDFCAMSVAKGVRRTMDFSILAYAAVKHRRALDGRRVGLYAGSEPFDYRSEPFDYQDAFELVAHASRNVGSVITAYPKGSRDLFVRMAKSHSIVLSLSHMNVKRLQNDGIIEVQSGGHEDDDPVSPVYTYAPGFLEELGDIHPPVVRVLFSPERGSFSTAFTNEVIPVRKAGRAFEGDERYEKGIGCSFGVILTNGGFFNVVQMRTSSVYPDGMFRVKIAELRDMRELDIENATVLSDLLPYGCVEAVEAFNLDTQRGYETYGAIFRCRDGRLLVEYDKTNEGIRNITILDPNEKDLMEIFSRHAKQQSLLLDFSREYLPNRWNDMFDVLTQPSMSASFYHEEKWGMKKHMPFIESELCRRIRRAKGNVRGVNIFGGVNGVDAFDQLMGHDHLGHIPTDHTEPIFPKTVGNKTVYPEGFTLGRTDTELCSALNEGLESFLERSCALGRNFIDNYMSFLRAMKLEGLHAMCDRDCLQMIILERWVQHLETVLAYTQAISLNRNDRVSPVARPEGERILLTLRERLRLEMISE